MEVQDNFYPSFTGTYNPTILGDLGADNWGISIIILR